MKKILPSVAFLLLGCVTFSQVGIGNTDPKAQLDITAGTTASEKDGLLIPRLAEFPTGVSADQNGMIVFITGNGTPTKGFYYWDNTAIPAAWVLLTGSTIERIDDLVDGKSDSNGSSDGSSVFLGVTAGSSDDSSDNRNVGVGFQSLENNVDGENNTAIGYNSLNSNQDGSQNTAIGLSSLFNNNGGSNNTALGYQSLLANQGGFDNTAVGMGALSNNVASAYNTSVGTQSLTSNTGASNSAFGYRALYSNGTGTRNVALGLESLNLNVVGSDNVAIGYRSGRATTGSGNVYLGSEAGNDATGDNKLYVDNTAADEDNALLYGEFGIDATTTGNILRTNGELQIGNPVGTGYALPTYQGTNGEILKSNGDGTTTWSTAAEGIATASNGLNAASGDVKLGGTLTQNTTIELGYRAFNINLDSTGEFSIQDEGSNVFHVDSFSSDVEITGQLGVNFTNPYYAIHLPNSNNYASGIGRAYSWNTYSDGRVKSSQENIKHGLNELMLITPKSYFHHNSNFSETNELIIEDESSETIGFIAQELYKVIPEAVQRPLDESKALWSVDYNKIVPVAVKAIQELNYKNNMLEDKVKNLENKLSNYETLEARLSALEKRDSSYSEENLSTEKE